jgi:hypothetical protein
VHYLQPSDTEVACFEQVLKQKNIQWNIPETSRYVVAERRVIVKGNLVDIGELKIG